MRWSNGSLAGDRNAAGFTLIEVIVSMTIMALLSVVVLSAVRTGTTVWNKNDAYLSHLHQSHTVIQMLHEQIRGAVPLFFDLKEPERKINVLAFEGDRVHIRFVSRNSFKDGPNGIPRWVEIRWAAQPQTPGNLFLEERRILSPSNQPDPNVYWQGNILQADSCSFDFLKNWVGNEPPAWIPEWPRPATLLPQAVRLNCVTKSRKTTLITSLDHFESSTSGLVLQ